jgi:hypothetical protein
MPKRLSDYVTIFMSALALGYVVYEIDRRQRKLREVFDVLDADDAAITARLEDMVASGELQPFAGASLG